MLDVRRGLPGLDGAGGQRAAGGGEGGAGALDVRGAQRGQSEVGEAGV